MSTNTQVPRGQIPELDGVRAIAILMVLACHFWPSSGYLRPFAPAFHAMWFGVDLFFVLSGFLITGILLNSKGLPNYYKNFYARRTLRIFPAFYAFLIIIYFVVVPLFKAGGIDRLEFSQSGNPLWYFFYLGNMRAAAVGFQGHDYISLLWSLAIEEHFYLLFPFVVARNDPKRLLRLLLAVWCFAPLFRLVGVLTFPKNWPLHYMCTFSRMDGIALGALLALVWRFWGPVVKYWKIYVAGIAIVFAGQVAIGFLKIPSGHRILGYSLPSLVFVGFVAWVLLHRGQPITAILRLAPSRYIGKISYGLYLVHTPLGEATEHLFRFLGLGSDPGSLVLLLAKVGVSIAGASLSWFCFEQPILRLKERFSNKEATTASTVR